MNSREAKKCEKCNFYFMYFSWHCARSQVMAAFDLQKATYEDKFLISDI